jgi:hypothetical protein
VLSAYFGGGDDGTYAVRVGRDDLVLEVVLPRIIHLHFTDDELTIAFPTQRPNIEYVLTIPLSEEQPDATADYRTLTRPRRRG